MNIVIIYHKNCYDGFCASWVASHALAHAAPLCTFIPMSYGDKLPEIKDGSEVYMLDFSLPRQELIDLAARTTLVVLDHHKTAQAHCEGLDFCTFDMNRSGAGLTWDYFHPGQPRPLLVDYVEDRDIWRFKLPESRAVHLWISSYPMSYEIWDELNLKMKTGMQHVVQQGHSIQRYQSQKIDELCSQVRFVKVADYDNIPTVNCPYSFGSDTCHRLLELHPSAPFTAYYLDRGDGEQQWGLRGRDSDDFDVSKVAETLGGGGHKKASGFLLGKR